MIFPTFFNVFSFVPYLKHFKLLFKHFLHTALFISTQRWLLWACRFKKP